MKAGAMHIRAVAGVSQAKKTEWCSLGRGAIIIDSVADESCWPVGQWDASPTKPSSRRMRLQIANGGDMMHYGQKNILFQSGGRGGDPFGLTFHVTDIRKPLQSVRRLVDKGNKVMLAGDDQESYICNMESNMKIPVVKKGGSFVIERHFVKELEAQASGFARPA